MPKRSEVAKVTLSKGTNKTKILEISGDSAGGILLNVDSFRSRLLDDYRQDHPTNSSSLSFVTVENIDADETYAFRIELANSTYDEHEFNLKTKQLTSIIGLAWGEDAIKGLAHYYHIKGKDRGIIWDTIAEPELKNIAKQIHEKFAIDHTHSTALLDANGNLRHAGFNTLISTLWQYGILDDKRISTGSYEPPPYLLKTISSPPDVPMSVFLNSTKLNAVLV